MSIRVIPGNLFARSAKALTQAAIVASGGTPPAAVIDVEGKTHRIRLHGTAIGSTGIAMSAPNPSVHVVTSGSSIAIAGDTGADRLGGLLALTALSSGGGQLAAVNPSGPG